MVGLAWGLGGSDRSKVFTRRTRRTTERHGGRNVAGVGRRWVGLRGRILGGGGGGGVDGGFRADGCAGRWLFLEIGVGASLVPMRGS